MHSRIVMAVAALVGAPACGAADEPSEAGTGPSGMEDPGPAPRSFYAGLQSAMKAESAIPEILEAGRLDLAAACADTPDVSIRIFNPLDPCAYTDVSCASVLRGDAADEVAIPAPVSEESDEPIGTAQQRWSPIGLGCSIFILGAGMVANSAICPRARTQEDATRCANYSSVGFGTLGVLCSFI
ncbi:uncharacterized protein SOCE26_047310 [Sorangium cellulosum]|uniref:Secreted protein n=1 Tax=Sorangium cellulosum TaxID=56 RepID=A0A2L0EVG2_SORCE|nr:hypothetical protein [Sorangium cellulosum]AUX43287.1 uncharacterized protein SOCE26_047310 [Sorangium cellulosum]